MRRLFSSFAVNVQLSDEYVTTGVIIVFVTSHAMANSYKGFAGDGASIFRIWKHRSLMMHYVFSSKL